MSAFEEQELKKVADALSALTPRPAHLDRDGILFEAGRRSVRPSRFWPLATVTVGIVAGVLALALLLRPEARIVVRYIEAPAGNAPASVPGVHVAPEPVHRAPDLDDAKQPKGYSSGTDKSPEE